MLVLFFLKKTYKPRQGNVSREIEYNAIVGFRKKSNTISMKSMEQYVLRYQCWAKSIKKQIININHLDTYL